MADGLVYFGIFKAASNSLKENKKEMYLKDANVEQINDVRTY
jgi:hypothetical protein